MPSLAWWAAVPVGCLATGILVVNNVRDVETDALAGKRTLPARFGRGFGVFEYWALLALSYAALLHPDVAAATGLFGLLPLGTLPLALALGRQVSRQRGAALNPVLARTALLLFAFGVLLGLAIILGRDR